MNENLRHDKPKRRNSGLWLCVLFIVSIWILFLMTMSTTIHF